MQEYDQTLNFLNQQIDSLERVVLQRADLQRTLDQLIQLKEQIISEKESIQQVVEKEEPEE